MEKMIFDSSLFEGVIFEILFLAPSSSSGSESIFDIGLKVISGIAGLIGLSFAIYVVFLKRKWKKDEEYAKEKEKSNKLEFDSKIVELKAELQSPLQSLNQIIGSITDRLIKLEGSISKFANADSLSVLKYNIDTDIADLKDEIKNFKKICTKRYDIMMAQGSLPDLKSRVDETARKIDKLEDFRHESADRYVLMANYRQDTRMITDAIGVLRDDLRVVMEMVDKL